MDIDTTILPTYGSQDGGEYVYHYDAVGYHPILCYDGLTGDILRSELRDGNTYCGKDTHTFVKPLLEEYNGTGQLHGFWLNRRCLYTYKP